MAGWFELSNSSDGQFRFVLKSEDDAILITSELYKAKNSAENGIASVQTNSPMDDRYERKKSSNGKYFFNLKAANHQVIGTSTMHATIQERDAVIDAVKTNGPSQTIKDNT
ncbi:MAG: YegP family protein [Isosphaeraceae bacterium]